MKKYFSIVLVCSIVFLGSVSVFATDLYAENESYDLAELFTNYEEKSFSEMVEFIADNPKSYGLIEYFRGRNYTNDHSMVIHMSGNYDPIFNVLNVFATSVTDNCSKYLSWGSRPSSPAAYMTTGSILVGEKGDLCFGIGIKEEFIRYINSLDRVEGDKMILNFLMNLIDGECVGLSFSFDFLYGWDSINEYDSVSDELIIMGDCNRDGAIDSKDANLLKRTIGGNDCKVDPLTVDLCADGVVNAKDFFVLKKMVVNG